MNQQPRSAKLSSSPHPIINIQHIQYCLCTSLQLRSSYAKVVQRWLTSCCLWHQHVWLSCNTFLMIKEVIKKDPSLRPTGMNYLDMGLQKYLSFPSSQTTNCWDAYLGEYGDLRVMSDFGHLDWNFEKASSGIKLHILARVWHKTDHTESKDQGRLPGRQSPPWGLLEKSASKLLSNDVERRLT